MLARQPDFLTDGIVLFMRTEEVGIGNRRVLILQPIVDIRPQARDRGELADRRRPFQPTGQIFQVLMLEPVEIVVLPVETRAARQRGDGCGAEHSGLIRGGEELIGHPITGREAVGRQKEGEVIAHVFDLAAPAVVSDRPRIGTGQVFREDPSR